MSGQLTVGSAVLRVVADWSGVESELSAMDKSVVGSMDKLRSTAGKAMTATGAAIVGGLGLSVLTAADFEQSIKNVIAVMGLTGEEAVEAEKVVRDLALTLGRTTVFSASQAAEAFNDLASKGFDVAAFSAEELKPILDLAAATQTDLTFATEVVTSTLRAFGLENEETTRIADVMTKAIGSSAANMDKLGTSMPIVSTTASQLGVSLEEVSGILSVLYDNGIDASTAATGLRNVMSTLNNDSHAVHRALGELGVSMEGVSFRTEGVAGVMRHLAEQGLTAEQALAVFGARNGTVAAVVMDSIEKMDGLRVAYEAAGGAAEETATMQLDTLQGALKLLASAVEAVRIQVGDALIPAIRLLADTVAPMVGRLAEWMQSNPALVRGLTLLAAAAGGLLLVFGPLLLLMPGLVALTPALGLIFGAVSAKAVILGAAIGAVAFALWTVLKPAFEAARAWVQDNWEQITRIVDAGKRIMGTAFESLGHVAGVVFRAIGNIFGATGDAFGDMFGRVRQDGSGFLDTLETIAEVVATVFEKVAEVIGAVTAWVHEHWSGIETLINLGVNSVIKPALATLEVLLRTLGAVGDAWRWAGDLLSFGATPREQGGRTQRGEVTLVGEQGPELAIFPPGTDIIPSHRTAGMLGGGGGGVGAVNMGGVHIHHPVVREETDIPAIAREVTWEQTQMLRRRGLRLGLT